MKRMASARPGMAFFTALAVLVVISALVTVVVANVEQQSQRQQTQLLNRSAINLIVRSLGDDLGRVRGDALALAKTLVAEQALDSRGDLDPAMRRRAESLFRELTRTRGDYAQLRLIDSDGHEVIRVDSHDGLIEAVPPGQLQDKRNRPYVQAVEQIGPGQVYVSRWDLNIEHGQIVQPYEPTIRVGTPVFSDDGHRLGMVMINLDGRRLLHRFASDARLGRGGLWLTDAAGNWLVGPDPQRDWQFALPGHKPTGLFTDQPAVWDIVRAQRQGQRSGPYGLLTFDQMSPPGNDPAVADSASALRVVALAPASTLLATLMDRPHLIGYALSLPILLLLAGWLSHLRRLLAGAEGEIAVNSRLLQDIFEHSSLAMKVKDRQGRIVRANAAAGVLLGREPEQLIGQTIDTVATAATAAMVTAHDHEVIESGKVTTYEEQAEYLGGAHTLLTTRFPVTDEHGDVAGVGAISVDITPRMRMEEWLRLAKEQAETANMAKATFLANMSHELRTPLNSIIGLGELLLEQAQEQDSDPLSVESLQRVVGAGRHLLSLINDILDISRVEAGHIELSPEPVMMAALAENVLSVLQPLAKANGNTLALELGEDPGTVWVDPMRMRQILINLVGNAIKFTKDGAVTLRLSHAEGMLQIEVADTGIGMSAEQMERIFKPFEQADRSISRRFGGSGLGLAICRQLVELMGGRIEVSSEPGQGSLFSLELPVSPYEAPSAVEQAVRLASTQRRSLVLVVDDDRDARDLLQGALTRHGLNVITASSGIDALQRVRSERPAVMLLDILLGDMSGWDVLTILRADPMHADLPVILCTVTDPDHRTASLGVIEHLTKPIDRDHLATLVRRFVGTDETATVLVVDDDDDYREQLAMVLRRGGHRVRMAPNGHQALQQMRQETPDLVLLDLVMPGMDGLGVIDQMQQDPALACIQVVLVTAADVGADILRQLNERAVTLMHKDQVDLEQIARKATELVDRVERSADPTPENDG